MAVKLNTAPVALAFGLVASMTSAAVSIPAAAATAPASAQCDWPAYRTFVERFVQADGRVIDYSTPTQQTTSEGQSYGMFFALVANDRATFDRLLDWTRTNLAGNQFDAQNLRLPAWQWGRKPDGSFGVLDPNSASDSDLWIAYDLLQAGRLWRDTSYTKLGEALAEQIVSKEVTSLPGLGPMLLPGPQGFQAGGVTRVNPSYLPLPVLRALAKARPGGPWSKLADNAYQLVKTTSPQGFVPDWAAWRAGQFVVDLGRHDSLCRSARQTLARGPRWHAQSGRPGRLSAREGGRDHRQRQRRRTA
jgi:endoglucanase